jgi:hypothetical protein
MPLHPDEEHEGGHGLLPPMRGRYPPPRLHASRMRPRRHLAGVTEAPARRRTAGFHEEGGPLRITLTGYYCALIRPSLSGKPPGWGHDQAPQLLAKAVGRNPPDARFINEIRPALHFAHL